ncbi:germination protein YpeB [Paenibacillus sp. 1P07SE]|uniref:germination protein YpeB n=1 Tax=Paenibacillus sp. 1P07SE TaxID=3132209 RepID=UPI0039A42696
MYKRLSAVLFPVMALMFIGAAFWGYQEHQDKNAVLIKAENQYQRAFHNLSYDLDQIHKQLGNTLAVSSKSSGHHRKGLVNVWRMTSQAQNEINQLPLTMLPFSKAEDFLSHVASFAYRTSIRDLTKEPLSDKEFTTLKTLYTKSEELTKDLQNMQTEVMQNSLRWMDVEVAMASRQESGTNAIIDGFRTMEDKVGQYPEIDWGPTVSAVFQKHTLRALSAEAVGPEEIKQKAARFLGLADSSGVEVVENGTGTEYETYTAIVDTGDGEPARIDYTKRGGELISFFNPREVGEKQVNLETAESAAREFLASHGYPDMEAVSYDEYARTGNFTYVATQDGVLIYPDRVTVQTALDDGQPVSMQTSDYLYEHRERRLPEPGLTEQEARESLNPDFEVRSAKRALIHNERKEEVLCYEFLGRINGSLYRIFINADTGEEESIEQVPGMNDEVLQQAD